MFTGIVEETGRIERIRAARNSKRLTIRSTICGRGLKKGDSLAVNGCCLTVVKMVRRAKAHWIELDLLEETWRRTNLRQLKVGARVNLERPLRADSRLGGHFVTGHIDGTGRISRWERAGGDWLLEIETPPEIMCYIIIKGSIAVDGISLTVAETGKKRFRCWIIPHTYEATSLRDREVGEAVNLEADILGKYVEKFLGGMP